MGEEELYASMQVFFNANIVHCTHGSENFLSVKWVSRYFWILLNIKHSHMYYSRTAHAKTTIPPDRSFENILSCETLTAGLWQTFVCTIVSRLQGLINALDLLMRITRHVIPAFHFKRFSQPKKKKKKKNLTFFSKPVWVSFSELIQV